MQVVSGVFLVDGYPSGPHQNGYIVRSGGARAMIDSGDMREDSFEVVGRDERVQIQPVPKAAVLVHAAALNRFEHVGPDVSVQAVVFLLAARPDSHHEETAFHTSSPMQRA